MGDIERNLTIWNEQWDWSQGGDEWSAGWGGTPALWFGALLPRIHSFVPAPTILEIAPGYGRWTQYLKDLCEHLVIVDLAERCIRHCEQRFSDATNIEYHVNDGRSLDMLPDMSVDFAFSFDSLVHAEEDVLADYLAALSRKLTPTGVAFIHHSNLGEYPALSALTRRVPERIRRPLVRRGVLIDLYAWRAESVTAERVATRCSRVGLACVSQEKISWQSGRYLTDALSVITPHASPWVRSRRELRNPRFHWEGWRMAQLYAFPAAAEGPHDGDPSRHRRRPAG